MYRHIYFNLPNNYLDDLFFNLSISSCNADNPDSSSSCISVIFFCFLTSFKYIFITSSPKYRLYVIIINILGNLYNKLYHLFSRFGGIIHFLSISAIYMNYLLILHLIFQYISYVNYDIIIMFALYLHEYAL